MFAIFDGLKKIFFPTHPNKRKFPVETDFEYRNDIQKPDDVYVYKDTHSQINGIEPKRPRINDIKPKRLYVSDVSDYCQMEVSSQQFDPKLISKHYSKPILQNNHNNSTIKSKQSLKPALAKLSNSTKSHLLDKNYLNDLLKPSLLHDTRQKELQMCNVESEVNKIETAANSKYRIMMLFDFFKIAVLAILAIINSIFHRKIFDEIRKKETTYMEDIAEKFKELFSIPSLLFPQYVKKPTLPKITDDMLDMVDEYTGIRDPDFIIVRAFNLEVTVTDLLSLQPGQWLTDNVINFYLELICDRNTRHKNAAKVQIISSFFYPKMLSSGYSAIRRWTKRRPIFGYSLLLVPIHLGNHWCFVSVDFDNNEVFYYDSLKTRNPQCLDLMKNFLESDSQDKLNKPLNSADWIYTQVYDGPTQQNGYDCGVFLCQTAEYCARRANISFSQDQMPYFRQKMSYEIISQCLLN